MIRRILESIRPAASNDHRASRLIVGLGNPGSKYAGSRHNVGFMTIDTLARKLPEGRERQRFESVIAECDVDGSRVILAKPLTMMNNSGHAVRQILRWYDVEPQDMLVIYDELDLPFGRIRLRPGGGSGGHNGLQSIIDQIGGTEFPRLRIGIGRPTSGSTVSYVLSCFRPEERAMLPELLDLASDAAETWLWSGVDAAMNEFNRREIKARQDGASTPARSEARVSGNI